MSANERITVNAQSSIRIGGEKPLYFDSFKFSFSKEDAPHDAAAVFVTHAHFDHFSPENIEKIANPNTVYVFPASMKADAKKAGISPNSAVFLSPGDKTEVCGFPVEAVPSYNTNKPMHPKKNGWLGYVVTVDGERVYVSGDMDATPEAAALSCDTALIPIGGTYTMNPKEAAALINEMKPKTVIPTHYGSVVGSPKDGKTFAALVDPAVRVEFRL